jgi:hypothetical protein
MMTVELNPNKQYILCGDISMSMDTKDIACGGSSRYDYMLEKFKSFIKESEDYDPDGPTVLLFGEQVHTYRNTSLDKIGDKLGKVQLEGFTNTHLVIAEAWKLHEQEKQMLAKDGKQHDGTVVFVFTDGEPTNKAALERTILQIANTVSRDDEFSIGFVLVGTITSGLRQYLDHIDNGLTAAKHDIVGTTSIDNLTFLKAVHNAINE